MSYYAESTYISWLGLPVMYRILRQKKKRAVCAIHFLLLFWSEPRSAMKKFLQSCTLTIRRNSSCSFTYGHNNCAPNLPNSWPSRFMTKGEICNQVAEKMRELSNEEKLKNRPNEYDQEKWIAHYDADGPGWNTRIWKVLHQRFKKRMDEKKPKIGVTGRARKRCKWNSFYPLCLHVESRCSKAKFFSVIESFNTNQWPF